MALLPLLALGLLGGYAAARAADERPPSTGVAEPVVAASPSIPVDPRRTLRTDPRAPALPTGLELVEAFLGSDAYRMVVPVPRGWSQNINATNEKKWKNPGNPDNTYVLRVEQVVSQNDPIEDILSDRIVDLRAEEVDVEILDRGVDSLEFTYVSSDQHLRHGFLKWLDLSGSGFAEVEVAITGREADVPGAAELIERVAAGIRLG